MVIRYMQGLSEQIANIELVNVNILRLEAVLDRMEDKDSDEYQAMLTDLRESKERFAALEEGLRGTLRTLVRYATEVA